MRVLSGLGVLLAVALIEAYRLLVSPFLPPACRYTPTCSEYAQTALRRHGLLRGGWLGVKRVCRCHPGRVGGDDPVPQLRERSVNVCDQGAK